MVSQTEGEVGGQSADRLDWALEVAGGLELQLVSHWMDLETVEPGGGGQGGSMVSSLLAMPAAVTPTPTPASFSYLLNKTPISLHMNTGNLSLSCLGWGQEEGANFSRQGYSV